MASLLVSREFSYRVSATYLAVVRPLSRHLEVQILLQVPLLGFGVERELVVLVVLFDEVLKDGARLPDGDARVWVLDGGDTAIGVDLHKRLSLGVGGFNLSSHVSV